LTDRPSIDTFSAGHVNDTTIALRWASSSAVSYIVFFSSDMTTIAFTTSDTHHDFTGIKKDASYKISVVPRNQLCQGKGRNITVSSGTGNLI